MATTNFIPGTVITSAWANDVDKTTYHTKINTAAYEVKSNGVIDDSLALNGLIAAVKVLGGGEIVFPAGARTKITAALVLADNVKFDLNGGEIIQFTNNTPVFTAPTTSVQRWGIRNGKLSFLNLQASTQTDGVGIKLANGNLSYDFYIKDLRINDACDAISCPSTTGSYAFVGRFENIVSDHCSRWGLNISCDAANGANTNLVFSNVWALQPSGSAVAGAKAFYFNACSMSRWESLFSDFCQDEFIKFVSCSGGFGTITCEAGTFIASTGQQKSAVVFSDTSAEIECIKYVSNIFTSVGTGEVYLLYVSSSGAPTTVNVRQFVTGTNTYTNPANIYDVVVAGNVTVKNGFASLDKTVNLADSFPTRKIIEWNGVNRRVTKNTTANRPVYSTNPMPEPFFDTTLNANGKPIWWTGTAWVDATGATV